MPPESETNRFAVLLSFFVFLFPEFFLFRFFQVKYFFFLNFNRVDVDASKQRRPFTEVAFALLLLRTKRFLIVRKSFF